MQNTIAAGARKATSPLRYAVGMFGTSIPINMFKTYAAFFYIDKLGLITTQQFSLVLFLYTFLCYASSCSSIRLPALRQGRHFPTCC